MSSSQKVGNMAAIREALTKVSEWMAHRIATGGFEASPTIPTVLEDVVLPALSAPPRACDVMSEDDLTKVVTDSFMKSLETRPEFNIGGIKTMVIAAISAAIKCAYDTQLVSKTEGATDGSK